MSYIKKLLHKGAHLFGLNKGNPESHYEGNVLIMCFRCYGCSRLYLCEPCDKVVERELKVSCYRAKS